SIAASSAATDLSRPTKSGTTMPGNTTMSRRGRRGYEAAKSVQFRPIITRAAIRRAAPSFARIWGMLARQQRPRPIRSGRGLGVEPCLLLRGDRGLGRLEPDLGVLPVAKRLGGRSAAPAQEHAGLALQVIEVAVPVA